MSAVMIWIFVLGAFLAGVALGLLTGKEEIPPPFTCLICIVVLVTELVLIGVNIGGAA